MLNERQVLKNIRLSDIQKQVLAMVQAAPNEDVAAEQVLEKGRNYVGAKDMLVRLGLMTFHDNEAAVTQTGMEVMRRANLVDEMGQLTDEGQQYAYPDDEGGQQAQGQQQGQQPGGMDDMGGMDDEPNVDQGPLAGTGPSFGEGFSLIKRVTEELKFKRQLQRFVREGAGMDYKYSDDPKEQTAYEDGYEAGMTGAGVSRSPYHKRNRLYKAWLAGYNDGDEKATNRP